MCVGCFGRIRFISCPARSSLGLSLVKSAYFLSQEKRWYPKPQQAGRCQSCSTPQEGGGGGGGGFLHRRMHSTKMDSPYTSSFFFKLGRYMYDLPQPSKCLRTDGSTPQSLSLNVMKRAVAFEGHVVLAARAAHTATRSKVHNMF